jgi:hypothetical protein
VSGVFGLARFELFGEVSSLTLPPLELQLFAVRGLCPVSGLFDEPTDPQDDRFVIGDRLSSLFFSTASAILTEGGRSRRIRADAAAPGLAASFFSIPPPANLLRGVANGTVHTYLYPKRHLEILVIER